MLNRVQWLRRLRTSSWGLVAIVAIGSACYRPLSPGYMTTQRSAEARELYRLDEFGREHLRHGGLTILSARLGFGHETYGPPLVQGLLEAMQAGLPAARIVHANRAAGDINSAGLADEYAAMLDAYDKTNILDREDLRLIADAVGVRYLAVPILVSFREDRTTRFSVFGFRLGKTASANARFQLQIWDGHVGAVVWEGIADVTLAQEVVRERLVRFEDTVEATWDRLLQEIPSTSVSSGPRK